MVFQGERMNTEGDYRLDTRFRDKNRRIVQTAYSGHAIAKELNVFLLSYTPQTLLPVKLRAQLLAWIPWVRRTFPDTSEDFLVQLQNVLDRKWVAKVELAQMREFLMDPMQLKESVSRPDFFKRCAPYLAAFPHSQLAEYMREGSHVLEILCELAFSPELRAWYVQPWKFLRGTDGENIIIGMLRNDPTVATYASVLAWMEDNPPDFSAAEAPKAILDDTLTPLSHALAMELIDFEYLHLVLDVHEDLSVLAIAQLKCSDIQVRNNGKFAKNGLPLHFLLTGPPGTGKSFLQSILQELSMLNSFEVLTRRSKLGLSVQVIKNGLPLFMDELPSYHLKFTGAAAAGGDKTQINMEKEAMSSGMIVTKVPYRDKETGIQTEREIVCWCMQPYIANTNEMQNSVEPAILDRFIVRTVLTRLRPNRDVIVEKYQMTENEQVRAQTEGHVRKWRTRHAMAAKYHLLVALTAMPACDTSVVGVMLPIMRDILAKHNITLTRQRLSVQQTDYLKTITIYAAIDRVLFAQDSIIEPGTLYNPTQVLELAPFTQCTVEHMCIAVGHMLPSYVDPALHHCLKAIVCIISAAAQFNVDARFTSSRSQGDPVPVVDYNYYLLDMSSSVRDGSAGEDGILNQVCTAINRYINANFTVRVSVEVVKDTMKGLLANTYKSTLSYASSGPGIQRGHKVDMAIVRQKSNSNRFGLEILREYLDYFMDWNTKDFNPGKDYASIGMELVEEMRTMGDKYYRNEPELRIPADAKIVTGLTMRYQGDQTKPYCYHVSKPRDLKKKKEEEEEEVENVTTAEEEAAAEAHYQEEEGLEDMVEEAYEARQRDLAAMMEEEEDDSAKRKRRKVKVEEVEDEEEGEAEEHAQIPVEFKYQGPTFLTFAEKVQLNETLEQLRHPPEPMVAPEDVQTSVYASRLFSDVYGKVHNEYVPGSCRPRFLDKCQLFEVAKPRPKSHPPKLTHFMPYPEGVEGAPGVNKPPSWAELRESIRTCEASAKALHPKAGVYAKVIENVLDTLDSLKTAPKTALNQTWIKLQHVQVELSNTTELLRSYEANQRKAAAAATTTTTTTTVPAAAGKRTTHKPKPTKPRRARYTVAS
jgi:hypothetical protein